ncbi:MAG: anti-sigma F factor antagonist [Bacilli bacterium]
MALDITMSHQRQALIVRLAGELDHHTADRVKRQMEMELEKGIYSDVIFNLTDLSFMDSSGIGVILGRYKQVVQAGGKMAICSVHPTIYRIFEMSGLFKIIPFHENETEALQSLGVA